MKLAILQGLPGSGKSRYARVMAEDGYAWVSSDSYPGLYTRDETRGLVFNPALAGPAHGAAFKGAIEALQAGRDVVVDNTNTTIEEISPYVLLGQAFGARITVIRVACDPDKAFERNTHAVPAHVFQTMVRNLERFTAPGFWTFVPVRQTVAYDFSDVRRD